MSKLDKAFMKAYAKVRVPSAEPTQRDAEGPQTRPGTAATEVGSIVDDIVAKETEEIWIDRDGIRVVLPDEGIVNVASFIARTSNGRTRGHSSGGGDGVIANDSPCPVSFPEYESSSQGDHGTALIDDAHPLSGPHFNPISVDLAAFDHFSPVTASALATTSAGALQANEIPPRSSGSVASPSNLRDAGTNQSPETSHPTRPSQDFEGSRLDLPGRHVSDAEPVPQGQVTQRHGSLLPEATQGHGSLLPEATQDHQSPPTATVPAQAPSDILPMSSSSTSSSSSMAPPANGEVARESLESFVAAWEVDRFEFEPIVGQFSHLSSPLWEATEQLRKACCEGLRVLAITSPTRGQGRSTLAITLAKMLASTGLTVALIDGDLDQPSLAEKLRLDIRLGWNDALTTELPIEEIAVQSIEDGLSVLPLSPPESAKGPRPTPAATTRMLQQLRACFDLIILDTAQMNVIGGWLPGTDNPCQIDAALVIDDLRYEDAEAMQACLRRLQRLGIEHVGLVENFAA